MKKSIFVILCLIISCFLPTRLWADTIHEVKRGETLFGIAHKYDVSVDQLQEWNPNVKNGVRKGMTIVIKEKVETTPTPTDNSLVSDEVATQPVQKQEKAIAENVNKTPAATATTDKSLLYTAKKGDTFAKISKSQKVSELDLIAFNPFLDPKHLKEGQVIRLSKDAPIYDMDEEEFVISDPQSADSHIDDEWAANDENADSLRMEIMHEEIWRNDTCANILVALPFMAESSSRPRQSQYYVDFYRGLLLAAEQLGAIHAPRDVKVYAVDTQGDLTVLNRQLQEAKDKDIAVIIAPEDEEQLKKILDFARANDIFVINSFSFRNEDYQTNPIALQGNIDQNSMYQKAIDGLMSQFSDYVPVILNPIGAKSEKENFVQMLRKRYSETGIDVIEVNYEGPLQQSSLTMLDDTKKYVFIPKSGSIGVFNNFSSTLHQMRSSGAEDRIAVFGYPDWTAYRGESLEMLHDLDALIYSRFFFDENDPSTERIQNRFEHWYGEKPIEAVPNQGILGYDTGRFLIYSLQNGPLREALNDGQTFKGVQSSFNFKKIEGEDGGMLNTALYLIRFLPSRVCQVEVL